MSETLHISDAASKCERYESLLPQIAALIADEVNLIANLANVAAALMAAFDHLWVGFYVREGDELVLGPFQGPVACTRIALAPEPRGVCGAAASEQKTQVVADVHAFPGHIACSALSRSEIVVPMVVAGVTQLVLDIDSVNLNSFDQDDVRYLEQLVALVADQHREQGRA